MDTKTMRASLNNAISDYTRRTDKKHRRNLSLEEMLSNISKQYGVRFSKEQMEDNIYCFTNLNYVSAEAICNTFKEEEESIQRIETILGKNLYNMEPIEIKLDAVRFFSMTFDEYQSENLKHGLNAGDERNYNQDSFFLLNMLKKYHGKEMSQQEIAEYISEIDHGLGDLHDEFCNKIKELPGKNKNTRNTILDFRDIVKRIKHGYKKGREEHKVISQVISEMDTVEGPQYKGSIDTGLIPVAMDFLDQNLNVILGKDPSEEVSEGNLWLKIYDINKDKSEGSVKSPLSSSWGGVPTGPLSWLNRGLNTGTDGLIYAVGDGWTIRRYDSNLREIDDKSGDFDKALQILEKKAKEVFPHKDVMDNEKRYRVIQASEDKGKFYFLTESDVFNQPSTYVFVVEGDDAGWQKLGDTIDSFPRMRQFQDDLYVKFNDQIHVIDKNMDSLIIDPGFGYINPDHCLHDNGTIWTSTPYREELFPSLKGISQVGEHITHVYPTPLYSNQRFSTLAISPGSKFMTHSNLEKNIALYEFK